MPTRTAGRGTARPLVPPGFSRGQAIRVGLISIVAARAADTSHSESAGLPGPLLRQTGDEGREAPGAHPLRLHAAEARSAKGRSALRPCALERSEPRW